MSLHGSLRGTLAPRDDRVALPAARPFVLPVARLVTLECKILAALRPGPRTLGELSFLYLAGLKAQIRDQAVGSLLAAGKIRLDDRAPPRGPLARTPPRPRAGGSGRCVGS
jgi:hypothetical protein